MHLSKPKYVGEGREREKNKNKKNRSNDPTRPVIENSKKVAKKFKKIKKHHCCFFPSKNKLGKADKERKKKKNRSDEFLPNS